MKQQYFALRHMDQNVCQKSSSGGAFTAISNSWFSCWGKDAVVYGCVLDETMTAKHIRAVTAAQRDLMQGSKYIGSNMSGVLREVETDLKNGKYVLFSGTPCQISGLKAYLLVKNLRPDEQLLTVEVICHGVGSVRFFKDYIAFFEERYKSKVTRCSFRGKMREEKLQQMVLAFQNGRVYQSPSIQLDAFYRAYLGNYILRDSCYSCMYAKEKRNADISLADFWEQAISVSNAKSLLVVNSPKGLQWIRSIKDATFYEVPSESVIQPNLHRASKIPEDHLRFWEIYESNGYTGVLRFLKLGTVKGKCKAFFAKVIYDLRIVEMLKIVKGQLGTLRRK